MNIKNIVKISFITVVSTIILIGFISISVTYLIRKNSLLNNQISQIILLQEMMNQVTQNTDHSDTIEKIDRLKYKFNSYEYSFEEIKNNIPLDDKYGFLSMVFKGKQERSGIAKNLKQLFINEHKIEVAFDKMYMIQEEHIKLEKEFSSLYPKERQLRSTLYNRVILKENFQSTRYFGLIQYYSKETLYQHKTEKYLLKWLNSIDKTEQNLKDSALIKQLEAYKIVVTKIGKKAIEIENLKKKKNMLQKEIKSVLRNNKKLASDISKMIEIISARVTNKLFVTLVSLIIFVIIFIVFFSLKVSKNIGLSVKQIEDKVQEGLKQITDLNREVELTQREVIFTMGTIAEYRSKETGNHVKRVAEYSKILALHYGLSKEESEMLRRASPMHDIGKVAIPDAILNKPGLFDENEREIMNTHAYLGYEMLKKSERPLLKTASIVAYEHHEKWDGSGYPRGLAGDKIHVYGRITALADVFDALGSDRVYKKAWDNEKIFEFFKKERGKHFEPKLVDIFFDNLEEFLMVQRTFKDI